MQAQDAPLIIFLLTFAGAIALYEIEYLNGAATATITAAVAASSLIFSLAHRPRTEAIMAAEGQETVEVEGFGLKGKAQGRRLLSNNAVILIVACLLIFGIYKHHTDNEAALARIYEAMAENTYVLSLPQAEREKLNIAIPESLRRKMRHRVND